MKKIDSHIQSVLISDRITLRSCGSTGTWSAFLLPTAVIVGWFRLGNTSELYTTHAIYSFNTLLNVLYMIFNTYKYKTINVTREIHILYGLPITLAVVMYIYLLNLDFRRSLCYAIANSLIYTEGIPFLLKVFPRTFTFGEVNIAVQAISLFIFSFFLKLNHITVKGIPNNEYGMSSVILLLFLSWIIIFCMVPFMYTSFRKVQILYFWGLSVTAMICLTIYYTLDCNIFEWLWLFLTRPQRVGIIILWLICSVAAVTTILVHVYSGRKSNTVMRKFFHFFVVVVFLSGIVLDVNLLYFSSGCVMGIFIVLEAFRVLHLPPLYKFLSAGFSIYCDEKDSGLLALTPICLLCGCALPLWLYPLKSYSTKEYLPLLSGVLSVGVGDSCASIGGKLFGKHYWKGTKKTIEGTICCVLSQISFLAVLHFLDLLRLSNRVFAKTFIAICITSLIEAKTDQIDNIVLPLAMYSLLMI